MKIPRYEVTSLFPTKLHPKDVANLRGVVAKYLDSNDFVTNRILRQLSTVTYDQAIYFFGEMMKQQVLEKIGTASATKYVLKRRHRSK